MRWFNSILNFIVHANLWIALGAFAMVQTTYIMLGQGAQLSPVSLVVFLAALLGYNVLRYAAKNDKRQTEHKMLLWQNKNKRLSIGIMLVSALAITVIFWQQRFFVKQFYITVWFAIAGLLSFLYALPFLGKRLEWLQLRSLGPLKTIMVALVWCIVTYIIPYNEFYGNSWWCNTNGLLHAAERFLFIYALTIPFDIKDLETDKNVQGLVTFPLKYGVPATQLFAIAMSVLALVLCWFSAPLKAYLLPLCAVYLSIVFVVAQLTTSKHSLWYTFVLDGIIIFYCLLIYIFDVSFS